MGSLASLLLLTVIHFFVMQCTKGIPSEATVHRSTDSHSSSLSEWVALSQRPSNSAGSSGFVMSGQSMRKVLLVSGTAGDSFNIAFLPEVGSGPGDYNFTVETNNTAILNAIHDITLVQTNADPYTNISALVDFHRFPGIVKIKVVAVNVSDATQFGSIAIEYLASGLVVYRLDDSSLVSGEDSLKIPSYEDVYSKLHWDLGVFVQFPNGTNSSQPFIVSTPNPLGTSLGDITAKVTQNGLVLWNADGCNVDEGEWVGNGTVLRAGCGIGFAEGKSKSGEYGFHFGIDFQEHRAGRVVVTLDWPKFTLGVPELQDEEFSTHLTIVVGGQPPSIVRKIEPGNPFNKDGGEELYVEMINTADVNVVSFNVKTENFNLIPKSRQIVSGPVAFYEVARFETKPGTGKNLTWTISGYRMTTAEDEARPVTFVDETGFLFSYDNEEIALFELSPKTVSELGGTIVSLGGNFSTFSPDAPLNHVLIGNVPVQVDRFTKTAPSEILFAVPPRTDVGLGYVHDVIVQIGTSFSGPIPIAYGRSTLQLLPKIFGASLDLDSNVYSLTYCGNTSFSIGIVGEDDSKASYEWGLYTSTGINLLSFQNASAIEKSINILDLPNALIPSYNETFTVQVNVLSQDNRTESHLFPVQKAAGVIYGVNLVDPESRTISTPNVNLRVVAKIDIPECAKNGTSLLYEWEYEDKESTISSVGRAITDHEALYNASISPRFKKYSFSYLNDSGTSDNVITPTRLGRELVVPLESLSYGVYRIRLTIRDLSGSQFLGTASTSANILKSDLVAKIGAGVFHRKVSDSEGFVMSAEGSYDPDLLSSSTRSQGLQYNWSCSFSLLANFSGQQPCSRELLPLANSPKFTIAAAILKKLVAPLIDEDSYAYIQYNLTVTKDDRRSTSIQQLCVSETQGLKMAAWYRVDIFNSQGDVINPDLIEFWEDVIISPSAPVESQWKFRVDLPLSERSSFMAGNAKLITSPGYYVTTGTTAAGFERLPLGILANRLEPHQNYQFSVLFQQMGGLEDEVHVRLKTVEVPELVFPPLSVFNGTAKTVFRSTATISFAGNSRFCFQFYLIDNAGTMTEFCIDGCTGANTVRFQISRPGSYTLQCRLMAANGRTLLSVKNNTRTLNVVGSSIATSVEDLDKEMEKDFKLGDDGGVNQRGFYAADSIHEKDSEIVSLAYNSDHDLCANYTRSWAKRTRAIVANDLPNTANARNYVVIAANYARLECSQSPETLYELLAIVDDTFSRAPPEEDLSTFSTLEQEGFLSTSRLEHEVIKFYNYSMTKALSIVAAGSSRRRLIPIEGEVSNIILDLGEMWTQHLAASAASGQVCGWEAIYTSNAVGGESDMVITPLGSEPPLGVNTVAVAIKCNKEQGKVLRTPYAEFEWCDSIYDVIGNERKLVTLAETVDFPYMSGVQGENKTDTSRLVSVGIATRAERNHMETAITESMLKAKTETCYTITMRMRSVVNQKPGECSENIPFRLWPQKNYGQLLDQPFQGSSYQKRTVGLTVIPETNNGTEIVRFLSNDLGLYGANIAVCTQALFGGDGGGLGGATAVVGIIIGILVLILVSTLLTFVILQILVSRGIVGDAPLPPSYVERDYFGRHDVRLAVPDSEGASVATLDVESQFREQWGKSNEGERLETDFAELGDEDVVSRPTSPRPDGVP